MMKHRDGDVDYDTAKNRKHIEKRERQWQTVGSSDDEDVNGKESHSRKRKSRDDSTDSSSSGSESDSSDSSSDSSKHKHKKHKKEKKSKHHKKEKKHKKDKKKDRKHDKEKHSSKSSSSTSYKVNQNEYGKYGILKEENFFHKQREFEAYMDEVKGIPGVLNLNKKEIMQHFKGYMEDYNTATMPHDKFYNFEAWEMKEYQRQQQAKAAQQHYLEDDYGVGSSKTLFNDEAERQKERKLLKAQQEQQALQELQQRLAQDKHLIADMKKQQQLQNELQQAFKRGDTATVKRLERLLAPEEEKPGMKHPWS